MTPQALRLSLVSLFLVVTVGCGDDDVPAADGGPADAGSVDAGSVDAASVDAAHDAASPDDAAIPEDSASPEDSATPVDAAAGDAGTVNACVAAGGSCVALVLGACATGVVGSADTYSCGGADGVECCLPPDTAPYCGAIGSFSEGWYQPDGTLICWAMCAGAGLACENVGTRSEGWYTALPGAACTTPMAPNLVQWANCAP